MSGSQAPDGLKDIGSLAVNDLAKSYEPGTVTNLQSPFSLLLNPRVLGISSADLQPFDSSAVDASRVECHFGHCSVPQSAIAGQSNRDVPVSASSDVGIPGGVGTPGLLSTSDLASPYDIFPGCQMMRQMGVSWLRSFSWITYRAGAS